VATVNAAFAPGPDEVAEARAVLAAMQDAGSGVALHKGKMIDRPVVLAAQRIIAAARTD